MKARLCLAAAVVLLAGPAFAQEPLATTDEQMSPPAATEPAPGAGEQAGAPAMVVITDLSEVDDNKKLVKPWGLPVDSVEEMDVFDSNGKKIGEVDAVLQDKNGEIKGVAIGYGGFLGFGEKGAVLTFDQLQLKDGTLITDVSEDQLSKLPEWLKK